MAAPRTSVDFVNRALTLLGENEITALDPGESAQAAIATQLYESTKETLLTGFQWKFATKRADLVVLSDTAPDPWSYMFALPDDYLDLQRTRPLGVNYELTAQPTAPFSTRLVTNQSALAIEYTFDVGEGLMPAMFQEALVLKLAVKFAVAITEDPNKAALWSGPSMQAEAKARTQDYQQAPAREIIDDNGLASRRHVPRSSGGRTWG